MSSGGGVTGVSGSVGDGSGDTITSGGGVSTEVVGASASSVCLSVVTVVGVVVVCVLG